MNREQIRAWAREAGIGPVYGYESIERFAALVAAEKEQQMIRDGYRKCAEGQRTTQFCGLLDAAVKAEREACSRVCDELAARDKLSNYYAIAAKAIRARGTHET
jgi:hypothetical protein